MPVISGSVQCGVMVKAVQHKDTRILRDVMYVVAACMCLVVSYRVYVPPVTMVTSAWISALRDCLLIGQLFESTIIIN